MEIGSNVQANPLQFKLDYSVEAIKLKVNRNFLGSKMK